VKNNIGRHITVLDYINYEKKVKTVMANNSSNIKKTLNNHPSSEVTEHKKTPQHIILKIQVLVWDRHKHVEEFNQIMRSEPSPLISLVLLIMSLKFLLGAILVVIIW
jgi:hypothetical protein